MDRSFRYTLTIVPIIVGFIALAAILATTFWLNAHTQSLFDDVVALRAVRTQAVDLRNAVQVAESSQRGFLYTKNDVYLAPYTLAKTQAARQITLLTSSISIFPDLQSASQKLGEVVGQKFGEMDQTLALQHAGRDADALAVVKSDRGKALMDEATVYLSGIVRAADQRLLERIVEQQKTAGQLRLVSIVSALVILAVVGIVTHIVTKYTRGLDEAQLQVSNLNAHLEERVRQRTDDLGKANEMLQHARNRTEALLLEVNHRVANSLTMVSSLVSMQAHSLRDLAAKSALAETRDRIYAVALVHRELYTTGDVRFVLLDDYLGSLIAHLQTSVKNDKRGIAIKSQIASVKMPIDQSISLGVVLNEWVTNALKYAYPEGQGEIRVELRERDQNCAELTVADDGVGCDAVGKSQGTGFGSKILRAMTTTLAAQMEYENGDPGTIVRITFPLREIG